MSALVSHNSLSALCRVSRDACIIMSSMVLTFYSSMNNDISKLKADKSAFTIADGIVQNLLTNHLFLNKFSNIVGEEDVKVEITLKPYMVDDLIVPEEFYKIIDDTRYKIQELSALIDNESYKSLSAFIDPIDGTKEFSTGLIN